MAIGLSGAEAKRQQVASSMMQLCTETELKLRENATMLEREIAGTMKQAQKAERELREHGLRLEQEIAGTMKQAQEARRELQENGVRLERKIYSMMEQALHKVTVVASPTSAKGKI